MREHSFIDSVTLKMAAAAERIVTSHELLSELSRVLALRGDTTGLVEADFAEATEVELELEDV